MRVNNDRYYEDNPEPHVEGRWFKPARYPADVHVCPLCELPETDGVYEFECDCWDLRGRSIRLMNDKCYYDNELCEGELWLCRTCGESFCGFHWHYTDKGTCVECVACERERLEERLEAEDAA